MKARAALGVLALLIAAPACGDDDGPASAGATAGSCEAVDGAPDPFPIERAQFEDENEDEVADDVESLAFPAALTDIDLGARTVARVEDYVVREGDVTSTWSETSFTTSDVTQTARIVDTPDEQSVDERYWEYEQWYERSAGGEWIRHDEPNGYEPPYRFADNMGLILPSSLAISLQDELRFTGTVDVDGVAYARYCIASPWVGFTKLRANTETDAFPTVGRADLWVHPDGYVSEMVAHAGLSDGRLACWATSLQITDDQSPPGLAAPAPEPPLVASRFGSEGCGAAG